MEQRFGVGDIVKVRNNSEDIVKVVLPILDEGGRWWYEVEAVDWQAPFHREVKQEDLTMA